MDAVLGPPREGARLSAGRDRAGGERASGPPALVLAGLSKRFGTTVAVDDVSLDVAEGEFVTLLGPSGCGKTTTLRLIAGFERPDAGSIRLRGRDVVGLPPQARGFGMVFQNYALFPHLDVRENVAFGLRLRKLPREEVARRVDEALRLVDLDGYGSRKVQQLSGGQQQRVALARALAPEPPLLLLDEPLSNLDAALRERTRAEIRALLKRLGITAIFVTHDQEEAFALSDRVAVMEAGRIRQVGVPETLYREPATPFVASFLGRANFVPARVVGAGEGGSVPDGLPGSGVAVATLVVELDGGVRWHGVPAAGLEAARGAEVVVMIRPEDLRLSPMEGGAGVAGVAADALQGEISDRRFAGAVTHFDVRVGRLSVIATAEGGQGMTGDRVTVRPADGAFIRIFGA